MPGHGPLGKSEDVTAFRGYLVTLRADVAQARTRGLTGDALIAAVVGELQPAYGTWSAFAHFGKLNVQQTDEELAGTKPLPGGAVSKRPEL